MEKIIPEEIKDLDFGHLWLRELNLTSDELYNIIAQRKHWGYLDLEGTPIKSLPSNLKVAIDLHLNYTLIESLPDDLIVDGGLHLRGTPIKSLPNNLKVDGCFYLEETPINKKDIPAELLDKCIF